MHREVNWKPMNNDGRRKGREDGPESPSVLWCNMKADL